MDLNTCNICKKHFINKGSLLKHWLAHIQGKPYSCAKCGKKFIYKKSFESHFCNMVSTLKYKCCPKVDENCLQFLRFKSIKHKCKINELKLRSVQRSRHKIKPNEQLKQGESIFKIDCKTNLKKTKSKENQSIKLKNKSFKASPLNKQQSYWKTLPLVGNDVILKCEYCKKKTIGSDDMFLHMRSNHVSKEIVGLVPSSTKSQIRMSSRRFREIFHCKICQCVLKSVTELIEHFSIHIIEQNPVRCHICKLLFASHSSLKQHMQIHLIEKSYNKPVSIQS